MKAPKNTKPEEIHLTIDLPEAMADIKERERIAAQLVPDLLEMFNGGPNADDAAKRITNLISS